MDARHGTIPAGINNDSSGSAPLARALKDIAFGSIAGMVSEVFEYPFDLAKVRLQSQVLEPQARFGGPWDCLVQTWRDEGIRGLYRGLPAPMVGAAAETAALFLSYGEMQTLIRQWADKPRSENLSISQLGLAAGGAGLLTSFILTPIELVKCRMQVQLLAAPVNLPMVTSAPVSFSTGAPVVQPITRKAALASVRKSLPGPIKIIRDILRTSGPRGLWLGHTGTLVRETGGSASWFVCKEAIASFLLGRRSQGNSSYESNQLAPWESAVSGAIAGGACVLALYPADTVKSAIQTADEFHPTTSSRPKPGKRKEPGIMRPTFWGTAKAMYRVRGWKGLYAGCGMTVARALPSSGIVFVVYDGLSQRFGA